MKKTIAESGFMDTAAGKFKDLTAAMHDPEVKQHIVELTEKLTAMTESALRFAVNYGEAVVKMGGSLTHPMNRGNLLVVRLYLYQTISLSRNFSTFQ